MKYYLAFKKGGDLVIWDNMDESQESYAKWNKPDIERKKKKKTAGSYLQAKSSKVEYIEAESRMVVTRGGKVEEMGRCESKCTKFQ